MIRKDDADDDDYNDDETEESAWQFVDIKWSKWTI